MLTEAGLEPSKCPDALAKAIEGRQPEILEILLSKFRLNPLDKLAEWGTPLDRCLTASSSYWVPEDQVKEYLTMVDILFHYGGCNLRGVSHLVRNLSSDHRENSRQQ